MSNALSRTDPRILRTRQLIREAFVDLMEEIELEKITVKRITDRAKINRVTFYLHYQDIPDMMEKMADEMIQDLLAVKDEHAPDPADHEANINSLVKLLEHIADNAKFYTVLLAKKRVPTFTERFMKLMVEMITNRIEQRGADSPAAAAGVPNDITVWYNASAFIGTIVFWLRNGMPYTPQYLAKQLFIAKRVSSLNLSKTK